MDTIYSLVTKPINQNVGIIRVSGPETLFVIKEIFPKAKLKPATVEFQRLLINSKFIDNVILLIFKAPKSFTGEDIVEIQFHGSMFIAQKILNLLEKFDLKQALPGEFTKQAFMNNKIDLIQSEAINQIILSDSNLLYEKAAENLNSKQSNYLEKFLNEMNGIVAKIYVSIDYPENTDLPEYSHLEIAKTVEKELEDIREILSDSKKMLKTSSGIKVVLFGAPNVGKSTLLNALLEEDRAIISNIPGTTRDFIKETFYLNGIKIDIYDTAGIREAKNTIEKLGIKKSLEMIKEANLLFILLEPDETLEEQLVNITKFLPKEKDKIFKVLTKIDKYPKFKKKQFKDDYLTISAKNGQIKEFLVAIENFISEQTIDFSKQDKAFLISELQINNFLKIEKSLIKIREMLVMSESFDLILSELEVLLGAINKILGKKFDNNYIQNLFKDFCLGK